VQGGISNGEPIVVRAAFKPTATIRKKQDTVNREHEAVKLEAQGATTPACCAGRADGRGHVALVLCDHSCASAAIAPPGP